MSSLNMDLGVLEHQMHPGASECGAGGIERGGTAGSGPSPSAVHPAQRGGALPGRAGPEGAGGAAEHFAARSGSIPEIPGEKGVYSPGAGAWGRPEEPGAG